MKAGIIGATGYGGVELYRILSTHPHIDEITLYSSSQAGEDFAHSYPHTTRKGQRSVLKELNPETIKQEEDVLFLAAPAGVSASLTPKLIEGKPKIIDLSGDLRLKEGENYESWYNKEAAPQDVLSQSVYGLPEWEKDKITKADVIANPGCYPTAVLLGLAPLLKEGIVKPDSIIVDAKSGVSGAGKNPGQATHFAHTQENLQIYKVNRHQHIPEIEQQLTKWDSTIAPITFSTHLVPMTRGIMATMYVSLKEDYEAQSLTDLYRSHYEEEPFVRIREEGQFPCTKDVYQSNYCDIGVTVDERTKRVTIVSVIDNLMKGAASQAVQNMNLVFGWDETAGLPHLPVYP